MRILLVTSSLPWPTHGGGNQRTNLLHRSLSERGQVDTVMISRYGKVASEKWQDVVSGFGGKFVYEERLAEHRAPWRWAGHLSGSLPHRLTHMIWGWGCDFMPDRMVASQLRSMVEKENYDIIVGRYMWALARSGVMGMRPTLLDVDDFETDVIEANLEARQPKGLQRKWIERRYRQVARIERKILDACDHAWVAKAGDIKRVGHDRSSILPNIPFVKAGQAGVQPCPPNSESKNILMVGTLEHPVNTRAIEVFLAGPWRQIVEQVPDAKFHIVGSGMTEEMRNRWGSVVGVRPIGFAEDLRQAYSDAAFTIVPIHEGGGTKIKVLESMLYGRCCVCAPHSLRGYEHVLENERSIIVADDAPALVDRCVSLLNDPAKRLAIAQEGERQVRKHFSVQHFMDTVLCAVDNVIGGQQTRGETGGNSSFLAAS